MGLEVFKTTDHVRVCLTSLAGSPKTRPDPCQPNSSSSHSSSKPKPSSSLRQPTSEAFQPSLMKPPSDKDQIPSIPSSTSVTGKSFGLPSLIATDHSPATHHNEHIDTPSNPLPSSPPVKRGRGRPRKIQPPGAPESQEKKKGKRGRPPKKRPLDATLAESKHRKKQKA